MTKERLEELIKQEAEIYVVADKHIFKYKLEYKLSRPRISIDALWLDICHIPYDYQFDQIFETETDAEKELERQMWKEKMNAERTERFEPPMWEDLPDWYHFTFIDENLLCHFVVDTITGIIHLYKWSNVLFEQPATKENYEKACEVVRDLFKGESNGKNAQEK